MQVALISTPFVSVPPKNYGGTELIVHELAEGLVARGHDVTVFATGDSTSSASLRWAFDGAQWPPEPLTDLTHVSRAIAEISTGQFDVVHAHSAQALALARFIPDVPMVYTIHHARDEAASRFYAAHPDAQYIAISADQRSREALLPYCQVIHHGLDPSQYEARSVSDRYLCFVGRFSQVKGLHTAFDVAHAVRLPIHVAGEVHAPDREYAERELAWRLKRPTAHYVGCVGPAAKRPLLRDARALLVPIEWNEPFGLIMIEAMLSGCPVVAFPRGSVPELVEEGITGFIARDADEMAELVRPGGAVEHFDRLRCRARAVERFSSERMVLDHERLYWSLARGTPLHAEPATLGVA